MQTYSIRLELNDIHDLLVAPQNDPFQANFRSMSGIEEVVQILRSKPQNQPVAITLVLPTGTSIIPEMETQLHNALIRYCSAHIKQNRLELEAKRHAAWRQFRFGLLFLGVSLGLASAITNSTFLADWLKVLLSNAVTLFGTVALWSPTDALLFSWYPALKRIRIYTALQDAKFNIYITPSGQ